MICVQHLGERVFHLKKFQSVLQNCLTEYLFIFSLLKHRNLAAKIKNFNSNKNTHHYRINVMFGTPNRSVMQAGTPGSAGNRSRPGTATRRAVISSGRKASAHG